jgi:hypothetical protein
VRIYETLPVLTRAFGLSLDFDAQPPGAWAEAADGEPRLDLRSASREAIAEDWSGRDGIGWEAVIDGEPFRAERGLAGDHRFVHGERPMHLLSADRRLLRSTIGAGSAAAEWRALLDSVLFSVALLEDYEALHAGAVCAEGGAVAIAAAAGGGKSTLLAELLAGGYGLLSDDVVVLEPGRGGPPLAHPGPPLMTVPASTDPFPGELIAALAEERWVAVPVAPEAVPLQAVVILNRRRGGEGSLHRVADPLVPLLSGLLRFPRTEERERARFELASAIAAAVPIWRLDADLDLPPAALADLIRLAICP